MVLELVYSDDERRIAQSTSKQIWNILYKDIVAPNIMQTEGGKDDLPEGGNPLAEATQIIVQTRLILVDSKRKTLCTRPR